MRSSVSAVLVCFCLAFAAAPVRAFQSESSSPKASTPEPNADQLFKQGLLDLQANHLKEACVELEKATKTDPKRSVAWVSLADAYWRLNLKPQALTAALTAEKTGANDPVVLHALSIFYQEMKDFKRAAEFQERYGRTKLGGTAALSQAAGLYLTAGDPQAALRLANEIAQYDSSSATSDLQGRAAWAAGQPQESLRYFEEATKAEPGNATYAFDYAQVLFLKGDFTTAADILSRALETHPNDAQLQLALGVARYGQRRFDDAAAAFLNTISLDSSLPQPYQFLGQMLDQIAGRLPDVTAAYQARYKREPKNYESSLLLAKALAAANSDPGEVERLLRESIALNAQDWESHFELGQALEKRRLFAEAAEQLKTAIRLRPNEPTPHYHLARVLDRLGDPDGASAEREIHARLTAAQKGESGIK